MSDPFRMYETARKSMYSAMEQEADPPRARQGYKEAVDGFDQFLTAAAKNRGMYRELEKKAIRMKETCQQKLQSIAPSPAQQRPKSAAPPVKPSNGVPPRPDDDDDVAPPRRMSHARVPSPTPNVRAPSPTSSLPISRASSGSRPSSRQPSPVKTRQPSPMPSRPPVTGSLRAASPSIGQIRFASPATSPTPAVSNSRTTNSQGKGRRRYTAESDSDSDSDKGRRERIRQSIAKNLGPRPATPAANTSPTKSPSPRRPVKTQVDVAGSRPSSRQPSPRKPASARPTDRRRMRLDSDSDEDKPKKPAHDSTPKNYPPQEQQHTPPKQRTPPRRSEVEAITAPRASTPGAPKPSTPAAKPRMSRSSDLGTPVATPAPSATLKAPDTAGKAPLPPPNYAMPPKPQDAAPKRMAPKSSVSAVQESPSFPSNTPGAGGALEKTAAGATLANKPTMPNGTASGTRVLRAASTPPLRVKQGSRDGSGAYGTIRAAVDAAQSGATIEIEEGEYAEQLVLGKPVTLKGLGTGPVIRSSGGQTLLACTSQHVHVINVKMCQTGGYSSKRGRNSARCAEVFEGQLLLERCTLQSEVGSGLIVADSGSATVKECTSRNCGKCGLLVFDGGTLLCNDSVISGNGLYGMVVQNGGTATVEGNRFGSNQHAGILVHGRSSVCTVRANDISTNGEMGVGVQSGAEVRLERSRVTGNVHAGLFVDGDGSRAAVRDCEIIRNGVRGIGVQSGAEVHVQGCSVSSNSQEGLFVSGSRSRATLQDNDLSDNGTKGVGVQSAAVAIIVSNRIIKNLEEGVFVSDQGSQATIRDNNVVENGMKGIGVQSCGQADIDGNLIHNNHREGVYVSGEGSKALIQNNDITENGVKGVGIQDGADVAVEGNRVTGNQYVGVHVYGERSRGIVRENDIRENSLAAVVTENGGIVQSADNRIDGVHESELAIPNGHDLKHEASMMPQGADLSFRGREQPIHDMTLSSPDSSPDSKYNKRGGLPMSSAAGNDAGMVAPASSSGFVQVEVVGATDLPKLDAFGLLDSFVCISLFGLDVGSERAVMSSHDTLMAQVSTTVKTQTLNPSWSQRFVLDRIQPMAGKQGRQEGLHGDLHILFTVHASKPSGEESRIGGGLVKIPPCSRTEHWLPLLGRNGEALMGRGGKASMLHVYVSYVPEPLPATSPRTGARKPALSRQSDTHEILPAVEGAAGAGGGSLGDVPTRQNTRIGELLWVIEDAEEVRRLTDKSSGISWNDDMGECCGTQGEVVAVLDKYVGMRFQTWVSWCFVYGALRRR